MTEKCIVARTSRFCVKYIQFCCRISTIKFNKSKKSTKHLLKIANKTEKKLLISLTRPETRIDQKLLTLFLWWCVDRRWFVLLHWWLLLLLAYTVNIYGMISGSMDVYRDNSFFFCVCEPMWTHFITRTDTESLWLFRFFFLYMHFNLFFFVLLHNLLTHIHSHKTKKFRARTYENTKYTCKHCNSSQYTIFFFVVLQIYIFVLLLL